MEAEYSCVEYEWLLQDDAQKGQLDRLLEALIFHYGLTSPRIDMRI